MNRVDVNQRSQDFERSPNLVGQKNTFNLSHDVKTTFTMGKLVPFLTLETLPGDEWSLRGEFMMRFAPLYLPIMHRVNMQADYFYVPNRILWPRTQITTVGSEEAEGWEFFITNQYPTTAGGQPHPYVTIVPYDPSTSGRAYELLGYMGFPTDLAATTNATWNVNAFYPSAYYMIYDQIYRNSQIQEAIWTQLHSGDSTATFPYEGSPTAPFEYFLGCKYRNWNRDMFTSATPTPQLGAPVLIPLVNTDFEAPVGTSVDGPFRWRLISNNNTAPSGDLLTSSFSVAGDTTVNGTNTVYLDIQETAGTIAQLRYALMLQEYLERSLRAGERYSDNMKAFWDVDPTNGIIQQPQWLGTTKGKVVVSEVMSTTETATLKVGSYAGQALSLESTDGRINYFCKEHGVILGIISVYPDSSYFQGIHRKWTRSTYLDYAWEMFAHIGDQEILNQEVNADLRNVPIDPEYNQGVFGYTRRYADYQYENDIVSGAMRTTFISFHLGRLLDETDPTTTALNDEFLQCRPDVTRVFQVTEGEDEIYAHIYNDVTVRRRLPKFSIPGL